MIVVMQTGATPKQIENVCAYVRAEGLQTFVSEGQERAVIGVVGTDVERVANVSTMPGVEQAIRVTSPHKLASLEHGRERTRIAIGGAVVGGDGPLVVIAGPCSVESREQIFSTARWVRREGAHALRGGAYKPRTSPYAFQGLGEPGLELLAEAGRETGMPVVSELTDHADIDLFERLVDVIQIGSRNMHNFVLLRAVGQTRKPVLLKRGFGATIEEWLMAAEYILSAGNSNVILCERGIRTFERSTRNTLDVSAVPVLREMTHLPIVIDPSHGTGRRSLVGPMALAAAAVGADGLIIEVHPDPPHARSDGEQSLSFPEFGALMDDLRRFEYLRSSDRTPVPAPSWAGDVAGLRARLDAIDRQLVELVAERVSAVLAVQQAKGVETHGHDVVRERDVLGRALAHDAPPLDRAEVMMIVDAILRASRSVQRRHAAAQVGTRAGDAQPVDALPA